MAIRVFPPVSSTTNNFDRRVGIPRPIGWTPQAGGFIDNLATVTVTAPAGSSNISFTNIPQYFDSLWLLGAIRTTEAVATSSVGIQFNSDTAANYGSYFTFGDGATVSATSDVAAFSGLITAPGNSAPALTFSAFHMEILDYADASRTTHTLGFSGHDQSGAGRIQYGSLRWTSTAAVSSIQLVGKNSSNIAQNSTVALFGVRSTPG